MMKFHFRSTCFGFMLGVIYMHTINDSGPPTVHRATLLRATTSSTSAATIARPFGPFDTNRHVRNSYFQKVAQSLEPVTDKVGPHHRYHEIYGTFLLPLAAEEFKMLEIGLGCNMRYGPGASVQLWQKLFLHAELWEAESDVDCVEQHSEALKGVNVLVGDQSSPLVLDQWIEKSGGAFDVIIDDGGHANCQIQQSFRALWPLLNPGGLYFVEDLQHGDDTTSCYDGDSNSTVRFTDQILDWTEQLMYASNLQGAQRKLRRPRGKDSISFIHCIREMCVLGKGITD